MNEKAIQGVSAMAKEHDLTTIAEDFSREDLLIALLVEEVNITHQVNSIRGLTKKLIKQREKTLKKIAKEFGLDLEYLEKNS